MFTRFFEKKKKKLTQDISPHDKGDLEYPKNDNNSFSTKDEVTAFCLCAAVYP